MSSAPPNWYPDPHVPGQVRYCNGRQWTARVARQHPTAAGPARTAAPTGAARAARPVAAGPGRVNTRLIVTVVLLAVMALFLVISAATSGLPGVLIALGLIGLVAALGQVATRRVVRGRSRRFGAGMLGASLAVLIAGGAVADPVDVEPPAVVAEETVTPGRPPRPHRRRLPPRHRRRSPTPTPRA